MCLGRCQRPADSRNGTLPLTAPVLRGTGRGSRRLFGCAGMVVELPAWRDAGRRIGEVVSACGVGPGKARTLAELALALALGEGAELAWRKVKPVSAESFRGWPRAGRKRGGCPSLAVRGLASRGPGRGWPRPCLRRACEPSVRGPCSQTALWRGRWRFHCVGRGQPSPALLACHESRRIIELSPSCRLAAEERFRQVGSTV